MVLGNIALASYLGQILPIHYTTPQGETSIGKKLNFSKEKDDSHNMGEAWLLCTQKRQPQGTQGCSLG
jgi:hypothetical protein